MRKFSLILVGSAVVCLAASSAMAQPPRGGQGRGGGPGAPPGGFMRMLPVMVALDANDDGEISADEIKNASKVLLTLDKNKDGKLTEDEIRPEFGSRGGRGRGGFGGSGRPDPAEMVARMMQNDKNKDGKLAKDEVDERMQGLITRADANKDGFVTKEELTKAFSEGGFGGRGGRGGRGGDGGRPQRPRGEGERPGESAATAEEGQLAPDFKLKSVDGKREVQLSSFAGKRPVALIFGSYT